jgi:NAD(P)-dependent dehydrogenase (short-subunit alcohol dehydrogenase family)
MTWAKDRTRPALAAPGSLPQKEFARGAPSYSSPGRRTVELEAAVKQIGANAACVNGDAASLADLDHLFAEIKRHEGRLDILFANAGTARYAPIGE